MYVNGICIYLVKSLVLVRWYASFEHKEHGINVVEEIRQPKTHVMFHSVMFQLYWYASTVTQNCKKNCIALTWKAKVKDGKQLTNDSHHTGQGGEQCWNKLTTKRDWITMRQRFSTSNLQGTEESNEVVEKADANDPTGQEFQTTHQDIGRRFTEVPPNFAFCGSCSHCLENSSSFSTIKLLRLFLWHLLCLDCLTTPRDCFSGALLLSAPLRRLLSTQ